MDLTDFVFEDSTDKDVQKFETEIMALKNAVEKVRLGDKLEMVEKIDKFKDHLLGREIVSSIAIKLLEEKLTKLEGENCGLKEKVGEIEELKMAIELTNNKFDQQEKKILELKENLAKMRSENCLMGREMYGLKNEVEKNDWEFEELKEDLEEMKKIFIREGNVYSSPYSFNTEELEAMERVFNKTQYPDKFMLEDIAQRNKLPYTHVKSWFWARRAQYQQQQEKKREEEKKERNEKIISKSGSE